MRLESLLSETKLTFDGTTARLGAAVGFGILFPPAALLPLVDTGLGEQNACKTAYAGQQQPGNPEPKNPEPETGASSQETPTR